jgi:hypothetical protein
MAIRTTVNLTKEKLELNGVRMTVRVTVGDWVRSVSVSPISYEMFEKNPYLEKVHKDIVKQMQYELHNPPKKESKE